MNIKIEHLLPNNVPDEVAFHIVKFVKDLALALESIYFEQMLHHSSTCNYNAVSTYEEEENVQPF